MLFSYYFDTLKTHLLNCKCTILQFTEKAAGNIEIGFSIEIAEIINGATKKKESLAGSFLFPPTSGGETQNSFLFTRTRYGDEKKWIFTVRNNINTSEMFTVGLISESANKNPLGMDVYHTDEDYKSELKANLLSVLENAYVPPKLTQTVADSRFEKIGYPERFSSLHTSYDSLYQLMELTEFKQELLENVPAASSFKISLNIAPAELSTVVSDLFTLTIGNLGFVRLYQDSFQFRLQNGSISDGISTNFDSTIDLTKLFKNGLTSLSKLSLEGDGVGTVTISYNGKTITSPYDASLAISGLEFKGATKTLVSGDSGVPSNWVKSKVDNILVTYVK